MTFAGEIRPFETIHIPIPCRRMERNTRLIDGSNLEDQVLTLMREHGRPLDGYALHLHLVRPRISTLKSEASEMSMRQKAKMARQLGMQCTTYTYPDTTSVTEITRLVEAGNANPNVIGIIVQMPLPQHSWEASQHIDHQKDIDALVLPNRIWMRSATTEATIRLMRAYNSSGKTAVIGSKGFIGSQVYRATKENDFGPVTGFDIGEEINLRGVKTVISAVGSPYLISTHQLRDPIVLGVDIGIARRENKLVGDFNTDSYDSTNVYGVVDSLTPVPGGMGPVSMLILAERTYQNAFGTDSLHIDFIT